MYDIDWLLFCGILAFGAPGMLAAFIFMWGAGRSK